MRRNRVFLNLLLFFLFCSNYVLSSDNGNILGSQDDNFVKNQPSDRFVENVELQFLDKITGKTSNFETKIGSIVRFERLEIIPLICWKSYPEEEPENKLLVKIYEIKGKTKKLLFYGWIFSSSPSVSGLEHQFYDVVLKNCFNRDES